MTKGGNTMTNKFISWRRVSTKTQGRSGLGLDAQKDIISYFVKNEGGELIADFCEVYTGKDLNGCTELRKAIKSVKETGAKLVIAKTDRFRNTLEALQILEEVGENNIMFCDLPHTDKFTLTLFFAIAEREALLISIRTKQALKAKKERDGQTGGTSDLWGSKNGNKNRKESNERAAEISAKNRKEKAQNNPHNVAFWEFIQDYAAIHGSITANTDFQPIADELNRRCKKTSTGLDFDKKRARAMYVSLKNIYMNY